MCDEGIFQRTPALVHLAARDLFCGGIGEAEFADGEVALFIAHRRTEGAALHGTSGVKIAGSGHRIEHGTWLVIGVVLEDAFVVWLGE